MDVTVNLDSALRHMRDLKRPRRIWADAIYINQNNYEQKGHQVAQMFQVYKIAQHTIIYLGESTFELDAWMWILTHKYSAVKQGLRKDPWCLPNFPDEFEIVKEQSA
ncbi:hypothetical protein BDZ45DRAFT_744215 [Acephala macrosclerotiorum]|nr:hypothetical protein BDZ45DRAFT_744215 [Acephala macrosclerotiorum]